MKRIISLPVFATAGLLAAVSLNALAVDEGTTIIGTKEAPTVLNVVPWQSRELGVDPWGATPTHNSDLLNDAVKAVDRDELQRQVEYFNLLQDSAPQPADP